MVGEEGHQLTRAKTPNLHFHSDRAELQSIAYFNKEFYYFNIYTEAFPFGGNQDTPKTQEPEEA